MRGGSRSAAPELPQSTHLRAAFYIRTWDCQQPLLMVVAWTFRDLQIAR